MHKHLDQIEAELIAMRTELGTLSEAVKAGPPNPSMGAVTASITLSLIAIGIGMAAHMRMAAEGIKQESNPVIHFERQPTDAELMDARIRDRMEQEVAAE